MTNTKPRRALVLSGGGGRGAYHVGVLRFLEEHDWELDIIVGTSVEMETGRLRVFAKAQQSTLV